MMTKMLCGNFERRYLEWEKIASRKIFRHLLNAIIFMFILLSNDTVFLVQFRIILYLWEKSREIALAKAARGSACAKKIESNQ